MSKKLSFKEFVKHEKVKIVKIFTFDIVSSPSFNYARIDIYQNLFYNHIKELKKYIT